jgi:organic hydroperoxide reductase OsmC/OhrA
MSEHRARIYWNRTSPEFLQGRYSREHSWDFDGGLEVPASSSPAVVRVPYSNPANVDPEEAFVASLASCHMLTFLYVAAKAGFHIESYEDRAVGVVGKNADGASWISKITLNPKITYGSAKPSAAELDRMHRDAHAQCYIANSVCSEVVVVDPDAASSRLS